MGTGRKDVLMMALTGCLLVTLMAGGALSAQTVFGSDIGSDERMVVVRPAESAGPDLAGSADPQPLRLELFLENVSGQLVNNTVVTAEVYAPGGTFKGAASFDVRRVIRPAERLYLRRVTGGLTVSQEDVILVFAEEVEGQTDTWTLGPGELADPWQAARIAPITGDSMLKAIDACIAFCDAREAKCLARCGGCDTYEFDCSCGFDGTRNSHCKCSGCPQ